MNKMMLNKKYVLIPVVLALIATMLMTPLANAIPTTTAFVSKVESQSGVSYPDRVISKDGSYAIFDGAGAMIVVQMTVNPPVGAHVKIFAYAYSGSPKVDCYSASSATPSSWTTVKTNTAIGTTAQWYDVGTLSNSHQFVGLYTSGGSLYVDQIIFEY